MTPASLLPYVGYLVDDALCEHPLSELTPETTLVGFADGFEPLLVGVMSYLPGCSVDAEEACEIAIDFLREKKWFADESQIEPFAVYMKESRND